VAKLFSYSVMAKNVVSSLLSSAANRRVNEGGRERIAKARESGVYLKWRRKGGGGGGGAKKMLGENANRPGATVCSQPLPAACAACLWRERPGWPHRKSAGGSIRLR
jgi:hypothetical protein